MTTSTSGGVVSAVHWVLKDPTADRNLSATLSNVAPRGIRLLPDGVRAGMTELIKTELGRALGTDMGAALVAGWRSYRRLVNEAQRSRTMAGQALIVALNPFETTWKQTATVAVRSVETSFSNVLWTFAAELVLEFRVENFSAKIENGYLTAIVAGSVTTTGKLSIEGAVFARAERAWPLHGMISVGRGIPLTLDAAEVSAATRLRSRFGQRP